MKGKEKNPHDDEFVNQEDLCLLKSEVLASTGPLTELGQLPTQRVTVQTRDIPRSHQAGQRRSESIRTPDFWNTEKLLSSKEN